MLLSIQLVGLGCGMRLATLGLALWRSVRREQDPWPALAKALYFVGWLTAGLLIAGAWTLWRAGAPLAAPGLRLALLAALAAPVPPGLLRRPHWSSALALSPAWLAVSLALALIAMQPSGAPLGRAAVGITLGEAPLVSLAVLVCAGAGLQALSEALARLALPDLPQGWALRATAVLLTLAAGGTLLTSLFGRGTVWPATSMERGGVAMWLAWSGLWVARCAHPRLREVLTGVAALALSAVAVGLA